MITDGSSAGHVDLSTEPAEDRKSPMTRGYGQLSLGTEGQVQRQSRDQGRHGVIDVLWPGSTAGAVPDIWLPG